jgi:hypothetical protein
MRLAAGSDEIHNLVMCMARYISPIDQENLITFIKLRIAPIKDVIIGNALLRGKES